MSESNVPEEEVKVEETDVNEVATEPVVTEEQVDELLGAGEEPMTEDEEEKLTENMMNMFEEADKTINALVAEYESIQTMYALMQKANSKKTMDRKKKKVDADKLYKTYTKDEADHFLKEYDILFTNKMFFIDLFNEAMSRDHIKALVDCYCESDPDGESMGENAKKNFNIMAKKFRTAIEQRVGRQHDINKFISKGRNKVKVSYFDGGYDETEISAGDVISLVASPSGIPKILTPVGEFTEEEQKVYDMMATRVANVMCISLVSYMSGKGTLDRNTRKLCFTLKRLRRLLIGAQNKKVTRWPEGLKTFKYEPQDPKAVDVDKDGFATTNIYDNLTQPIDALNAAAEQTTRWVEHILDYLDENCPGFKEDFDLIRDKLVHPQDFATIIGGEDKIVWNDVVYTDGKIMKERAFIYPYMDAYNAIGDLVINSSIYLEEGKKYRDAVRSVCRKMVADISEKKEDDILGDADPEDITGGVRELLGYMTGHYFREEHPEHMVDLFNNAKPMVEQIAKMAVEGFGMNIESLVIASSLDDDFAEKTSAADPDAMAPLSEDTEEEAEERIDVALD
jgi:hypothetical protein